MTTLVPPKWLAERLTDPTTVVLDATLPPVGFTPAKNPRAQFLAGHIPGALFFDIEEFSDHTSHLPHMLPSPEDFARQLGHLGIRQAMTIVVYEQGEVFSAPRAWWMLRALGAANVHLLDGGLNAWLEAGFPLSAELPPRAPCTFDPNFNGHAVKSFAQVQRLISEGGQILDARSSGRFAGTSPEPRTGVCSGHMPTAINVPFKKLTNEMHLKSADELRKIFIAKEVNLDHPITTTCGSGITAAVITLALHLVGAQRLSLYDGSWSEYAQQAEALIVKNT